jgi:poly(3-hydroxybutyrate) depolymerase
MTPARYLKHALQCLGTLFCLLGATHRAFAARHTQDTGFLDRSITVDGVVHRYVVYLPENWSKTEKWPTVLFLHGSGERGTEGLDETQIGLPAAIRVHPERWPFVVVMPQVPFGRHHWTDPEMMQTALAALHAEQHEFNGDPDRTYLTGLSLGGYGVWEIARDHPHIFAAIAPVSGGIFWSYQPARWNEQTTLPAEYARVLRHEPIWMFHGADDPVVSPKQSVLLFEALKAVDGDVRFWEYAGVKHNAWDRAYGNAELPHWLLSHSLSTDAHITPVADRILVPIHPVPARVNPEVYDAYVGEYEGDGRLEIRVFRDGDQLYQRGRDGNVAELLPESNNTFFFPSGSTTRLTFERDPATGQVRDVLWHDDRHEERWDRMR